MAEKTRGIRVEQGPKRVRAYLGGEIVADTKTPFLVWEWPHYPTYYIPAGDVRAELVPAGQTEHSPSRGDGQVYHIKVAGAAADGAALRYPDSPIAALRDLVRLDWKSMSEWFEEDEPVYTHPRDPYSRVDILASSRHVRVEVDGMTVADSRAPRVLFETALPPRFYLPMSDVRMDLLEPSSTVTHCPYKGAATYWSLVLDDRRFDDFAWCYRAPFPESQKIAGLVCFYNEKVDLHVDGELHARPTTKFS